MNLGDEKVRHSFGILRHKNFKLLHFVIESDTADVEAVRAREERQQTVTLRRVIEHRVFPVSVFVEALPSNVGVAN